MVQKGLLLAMMFMGVLGFSQNKIFIGSEVPIEVGTKGYLLTTEPRENVAIETWDSAITLLIKPVDGPILERYIRLDRTVVHYVVSRNREGVYRVWYRGSQPIPEAHLLVNSTDLPEWPYLPPKSLIAQVIPSKVSATDPPPTKAEEVIPVVDSIDQDPVSNTLISMKELNLEFDRLQTAMDFVASGATVKDIARISEGLTYETSKLEFFIKAYRHCKDPENYKLLLPLLAYDSSRDQLLNEIK